MAGCIGAVADLIGTITAAGNKIHRQRRLLRDERAIKLYCFDTENNRICGWFISPAASNTTVSTRHPGFAGIGQQGGGQVITVMQVQTEVYFGLDDALDSETVFMDLVWQVADKVNSYGTLAVPGIIEQLPCDVEQFGYAMLAGSPLVHFARINVAFRGRTRPV